MTEKLISLQLIEGNPYQTRIKNDPEHIENLARSIAADGLLQKPTARHFGKNGGHQLAFGHSRLKAFEWLRDNWKKLGLADRYTGYTVMPLEIADLTEMEMYRFAITENVQRKDLNPIELANAMIVYREQFKQSSDEIGTLFGMNGATVRGIVRLLDLPEAVQEKVASGEITQGVARKLLTIARMDEGMVESAAAMVKSAADEITAGSKPDDVIDKFMRDMDTSLTMWSSWNDGKPRGGPGLWFLDMKPEKFPQMHLPELKAADVAKALGMEFTADLRSQIEDYIPVAQGNPQYASEFAESIHDNQKALLMERIGHLLNPPSCSACPYHAVVDRNHYCGFKACHQRKTAAWLANEMQEVSKRLSIPIYDPAVDGKTFSPLCDHSYMNEYQKHDKLVQERNADLRLQIHKAYEIHQWTGNNFVRVILVGPGAEKAKEREHKAKEAEKTSEAKEKMQQHMMQANRNASDQFEKYAIPIFGQVFNGLDNIPAMAALVRQDIHQKKDRKQLLADLRTALAWKALENLHGYNWELFSKGAIAVAKYLQGVATTWGVKLPADFLEVAKGYQDAVAVETAK